MQTPQNLTQALETMKREMQKEMTELVVKETAPDQNHRKLSEDITKIRLEHQKKNTDLTRIQCEYAEAVKNMGKK